MANQVRKFLVTGGAGFIGSGFVEQLLARGEQVVVLDALTYAGHVENLGSLDKLEFIEGNICDLEFVHGVFKKHRFDVVVNFAAESHVDRSISSASEFIQTNIIGVFNLLDASLRHWEGLAPEMRQKFRFVQISTDEVFGSLSEEAPAFNEKTPYAPSSPYSSSKASGDHLARAWFHTYGLPVTVTNCSNNYGPRQFPEKLIPHMINCALQGKPLPVYGNGKNIRDWIHVEDHCAGILLAIDKGRAGESYCFGGRSERRNIGVVQAICAELDQVAPRAKGSYSELITYVEDRKGHDWRYAIDDSKAESELGFKRKYVSFEEGLKQTVRWYLENKVWMKAVLNKGN